MRVRLNNWQALIQRRDARTGLGRERTKRECLQVLEKVMAENPDLLCQLHKFEPIGGKRYCYRCKRCGESTTATAARWYYEGVKDGKRERQKRTRSEQRQAG